jgi:outer membrane protein assembly factor BamE (lipoprotein component of BamABCDE complex)/ketosteroid isomerase-like protein
VVKSSGVFDWRNYVVYYYCSEYTDYKVNPMRNSILFVLVVASLESGCGAKLPSVKPFKMEVQQGNVVTSKMLLQLRPGMTRSQVRYIMGTPLIVDSFRDNRWDYFYELRKEGKIIEKRRVILDFDKDSLVSVRGDVIPSAENPDVKTIAEAPQKKVEEAKAQSWTERLKFWESEEGAASDKTTEATATAAAAVTPESKVAEPTKAESAKVQPAAEVNNTPSTSATTAVADDEVVPYIPEGEYQAAPTPEEMAKGNLDATANQVAEAKAHPVNEKEMAAQIADTVEPPPVFQQEPMAEPVVAAEPEPVLPPAVKAPSPAAKSVVAPVVAAASVAAAAAKPAEQKSTVQHTEVQKSVAQAPGTAATIEDDEVIPYIPEGEYVAPVIPTEAEMVKGNMAEANMPSTDAEARQVTEKGVAPKVDAAAESSPTFVAEQLPEPEPEPELPPPPPPSASKPAMKEVAPVAALAAAEEKPVVAQPEAEQPAAKVVEPMPSALPVAAQEAPVGDGEINQAVAAWAQAWRSKDIKNYLAAYAPDFVPEGLPSRKAWEAQRKQRLSAGQGIITLVLNDVQIQRDSTTATVQFEQTYAAKAYKDKLAKTLEMRYEPVQKRWLIARERVAPLTSLPAVAAAPSKVDVIESVTPATQATPTVVPAADISVESAIDAWAQAWRSKNINAYLSAYSPEFVPEGLPSKSAWEAQRKKRLSPQQGKISLEITNVSVTRDGDTAVATFTQKYAAKAYRDEVVKRLQLKLDAASNRWLIVREGTASGAEVAVGKQQVTAPEESAEHLDGVLEQIGF